MFDKFLRKWQRKAAIVVDEPPHSNVTVHTIIPKVPVLHFTSNDTLYRPGKWVTVQESWTGVISKIQADGIFVVARVNPADGTTIAEEFVYPGNARIAKYSEIPECRRGISVEQAACLGYFG